MSETLTDRPTPITIQRDDEAFDDLVASVRPRLEKIDEREVSELVQLALTELGPVRVTAFLPVLVERSILERVEHSGRRRRRR